MSVARDFAEDSIQRIAGDAAHPFIAELKRLMHDNADLHKRIADTRHAISRNAFQFTSKYSQNTVNLGDIPKECIYDHDTSRVRRLVEAQPLQKIALGIRAPSLAEVIGIARDHGLTGKKYDQFVESGKTYIAACKEQHASKAQKKTSRAKPREEKSYKTHTSLALDELRATRGMTPKSKKIGPLNGKSPHGEAYSKPVSITVIGSSQFVADFFNGSRPNKGEGRAIADDRKAIEFILNELGASEDEARQIWAAYDKDVECLQAGTTTAPEPKKADAVLQARLENTNGKTR